MKYSPTCAGYFGVLTANQSLNSRFLALIKDNPERLKTSLVFPQRIPRGSYLDEIINVQENPKLASQQLSLITGEYKKRLELLGSQKSKIDEVEFLNLVKVLIRYSQLKYVQDIHHAWVSDPLISLELKILVETASSSYRLNDNLPPEVKPLRDLVDRILPNLDVGPTVYLLPIARYVVAAFRYHQESDFAFATELSKRVFDKFKDFQPQDLQQAIHASFCFRAIAMAKDLGSDFVQECMKVASNWGRLTFPNMGELEAIAAKENLYTCMQSMSKMNLGLKRPAEALTCFDEMIRLDPFDPIAYLEKGLCLKAQNRFEEAIQNFQAATDLGPPGQALVTFLAAQSFVSLNRLEEAKKEFYRSAEFDSMAISPWIELAELCQQNGPKEELKLVVQQLLNNPSLQEQLSEEERIYYTGLLDSAS